MRVGIFGSWRIGRDDPIYSHAAEYGRVLAAACLSILTGGYSGVMEAACKGAVEVGGATIGVTCPEIDRLLAVNRWVNQEIKARDLQERLAIAFRLIDAAVFFPGRSGTITELALAIELREKGILRHPILLPSEYWDDFLRAHAAVGMRLPYETSAAPNSTLFEHCLTPTYALARLSSGQ